MRVFMLFWPDLYSYCIDSPLLFASITECDDQVSVMFFFSSYKLMICFHIKTKMILYVGVGIRGQRRHCFVAPPPPPSHLPPFPHPIPACLVLAWFWFVFLFLGNNCYVPSPSSSPPLPPPFSLTHTVVKVDIKNLPFLTPVVATNCRVLLSVCIWLVQAWQNRSTHWTGNLIEICKDFSVFSAWANYGSLYWNVFR